jgi:hypothetical protein
MRHCWVYSYEMTLACDGGDHSRESHVSKSTAQEDCDSLSCTEHAEKLTLTTSA